MSVDNPLKRSPLDAAHRAAGARLIGFAGWELPVRYSSVVDEHNAVRTHAGLFDVSHMGEVRVKGPGALDYLQRMTCNDVGRLRVGRAQYNGLTTPEGGFVDDLLVYRLGDEDYLLVVNAANRAKDVAWLESHVAGEELQLADESEEWAQLALQGPEAEAILTALARRPPGDLRYYGFRRDEVAGTPCIVSRTGYTGEDGFELYAAAGAATGLWEALLAAGRERGLVPVGLAARDTLRLEAKMTLYGNDIDETTTVLEADLGWIVKLGKGEFIGRSVLARQAEEGVARKLIGFEMRGRAIARHGYAMLHGGTQVGRVTSGSFAPFLEKSIGLAYLPVALAEVGTELAVEIRGRAEPAVVVPTPFYKRSR
jgi:aminomethyltransferase